MSKKNEKARLPILDPDRWVPSSSICEKDWKFLWRRQWQAKRLPVELRSPAERYKHAQLVERIQFYKTNPLFRGYRSTA